MKMPLKEYPGYAFGMALFLIFAASFRIRRGYGAIRASRQRRTDAVLDAGARKRVEPRSRRTKLVRHPDGGRETVVGYHD